MKSPAVQHCALPLDAAYALGIEDAVVPTATAATIARIATVVSFLFILDACDISQSMLKVEDKVRLHFVITFCTIAPNCE